MGICVCIHVCMHSCTQRMYRYILLKVILFIYMPIHTHKHTWNQRERLFLQQIQNWSHIISFTRTHLNKPDFLLWHLSSHIHPISSVNLNFFFWHFCWYSGPPIYSMAEWKSELGGELESECTPVLLCGKQPRPQANLFCARIITAAMKLILTSHLNTNLLVLVFSHLRDN